jgi:hypothetical protein
MAGVNGFSARCESGALEGAKSRWRLGRLAAPPGHAGTAPPGGTAATETPVIQFVSRRQR